MGKKKIALVTGGTSGVGLSLVKALIENNYYVVFIGSNNKKGIKTEAELNSSNTIQAEFICLDLSNLTEVYRFTQDFTRRFSYLHVLVNAAGVLLPRREITKEGFEKTFAIGYLSAFILSLQLATLLKKAEGARIVNVSVKAKTILSSKIDFANLDFSKNYNGFRTSLITVHAKTVLTEILHEKLALHSIDVNSFHPGIVRSNLTQKLPVFFRLVMKAFSPFMSSVSSTGVFVATSEKLKGSSDQLYINKKPIQLNFDNRYKEALWQETIQMLNKLKINFNEIA